MQQTFPHLNFNPTNTLDDPVYPVPPRILDPDQCPTPHITSMAYYRKLWQESIEKPTEFWGKMAKELLDWYRPFTKVSSGGFKDGDISWFSDGELNACYNCVDRWAEKDPEKVAIIYEADEPNQARKYTFGELKQEVCRLSNALLSYGLRKGDTVAIYKPMVPEAVVAFLACARIGCPHTVIFAGFSSESLRDRINDANAKVLITADEGKRGGKIIHLKKIVDEALIGCPSIKQVIVYRHTSNPDVPMKEGRDEYWQDMLQKHRPVCPCVPVNAEDPLFLLYTSGSTGKPKGVLHTTAGYLLGAAMTQKYVFDYHEGDIFGCVADVGWITGHSYIVYGPLCNGASTVLFESVPTYPDGSRYWDLVAEHKLTQFYTAPTAIRALRRLGDHFVMNKDLSTLRIIGSVGEPINPEAWEWYYHTIGHDRCALVDTYWQTETGSIIITPLPGVVPTKPGSATVPFFGIDPVILDPQTGEELLGNEVTGVLALRRPFPSIARTIYGDHKRFMDTYLNPYPGYYFTGDGAMRDKDGYYWILGRVDDVLNVSGHRLSTSEIESALIQHPGVAEAAVVGKNDDITGQCIFAFVTLKKDYQGDTSKKEFVQIVRKVIGPFASPKEVVVLDELPKTRSGKIVRRILRKVVNGEQDSLGDLSTIANPEMIQDLLNLVGSP